MTIKRFIGLETVILFLMACGEGFAFAFFISPKPKSAQKVPLPIAQSISSPARINSPIPTPTLTPAPVLAQNLTVVSVSEPASIASNIPSPQTISQISPDGAMQFAMTVTTNKDLSKSYIFVTTNIDGSNPQTVYTSTSVNDSMGIPFNTFSPDNKYVFINHGSASGNEAIVVRVDGMPISDKDFALNIATIFAAKNNSNVFDVTTGWAAETLLIVNTKTASGEKGPSYWFELPKGSVIALSTQF